LRDLLDALLPPASFLLLLLIAPDARRLVTALVWSAALIGLVAILQYVNLDPFNLIGLTGSSSAASRMRVFSTLGNPNFVSAFLVSLLPLSLDYAAGRKSSGIGVLCLRYAPVCLLAMAVVATGSRAPILALAAAGAWLLFRRPRAWLRFVAIGLIIIAILLVFSPARPLDTTVEGRWFLYRIIAGRIAEIPLAGFGPGSFPLRFAGWETDYLRLHPEASNLAYAGILDHAHNDYLEFLVDHGALGLAAFIVMLVLILRLPRNERAFGWAPGDATVASIIAMLAVALVDFPLHRPAELYLFWTLAALLWIPVETAADGTASRRNHAARNSLL
jgi:O-antigen ligase